MYKYIKYKTKYIIYKNKYNDLIKTIKKEIQNNIYNIIIKYLTFEKENLYYELLQFQDLQACMLPIYYLFDNDINEIGSKVLQRDTILDILDIHNLLGIDKNNIINIETASHATLFYIFEYERNIYIEIPYLI
jgi:hypothetical protein